MASTSNAYVKARQLIDDVHKRDPLYVKHKEQQAAQGAAMASVGIAVEVTSDLSSEKASGSVDETEGGQDELEYANAMEEWVIALMEKDEKGKQAILQIPGENPIELIKLAARCQHLERFATPRNTFPEGKAGYLHWRRSLYTIQADKASALLIEAGVSEEEAKLVHTWVSKTDLKPGKEGGEWGTQVSMRI